VFSAHNTLDDGHVNMTITPNAENGLMINYTGNDYSDIVFNRSSNVLLGKIGFSNNIGLGYFVQNWTGTNILSQPADHSSGIKSFNNTLDDGSGNMYGGVDNTFLSWDDGSNRIGLVKKSGLVGAISSAGANNIVFNNYTTGAVSTFTSALISQVTPNTVFTIGYSGIVTSLNNTLDDGHGNMTITPNNETALTINYIGNDYSYIRFNQGTTTQLGKIGFSNNVGIGFNVQNWTGTNILYQPADHSSGIRTFNSVLDDGNGNMTLNGNATYAFPLTINSASTSADTVGLILSNTNTLSGLSIKWDNVNGIQFYDTKNANIWLRQGNTNTGSVQTVNNTLDNGNGGQQFLTISGTTHGQTLSTPLASVYMLLATGIVLPAISSVGYGVPIVIISEILAQTITCNASDTFSPSGSTTISLSSGSTLGLITGKNLLNNSWFVQYRNAT
jgi:hypothetical protein